MTKLVVVAAGYEGVTNTYVVEGKNRAECIKKIFKAEAGYEEEDFEEDEELQEMNSFDEKEWIDKLESYFDPSDFCLQIIYDVNKNEFIYEDNMGNGYIL